jgi:sulfhydrogenase subunit gamma (sulfur reductase)
MLATIDTISEEVTGERGIRTFRIKFNEENVRKSFSFKAGQCVMVSLFGIGECMFAISSPPSQRDFIEISVMRHGKVTRAFHELETGDTVGVRGPYGNHFDVISWKGKNLVFIGGGIGQAPLRSVYYDVLSHRKDYGTIDIIYGARTSNDLCYKEELRELEQRNDVNIHLSIDKKEDQWTHFVGFVPDNLIRIHPSPKNSIAVTCGPPIMIVHVIENLLRLGFSEQQIYTTLEMRMKCGIGICGRCNIGNVYVCKDGPVFSYDQLKNLKGER